ncbi:L-aspartate dehydrogenase [Oopsacas minuta]|uniref:Aspartate dehydrogenase domain-containing protein n=1 Tax=Oopsacas minuta TaxID=111878 RepID=A0AAV7JXK3_9METZ|nr:L-aspartate dehydrogenase [Oopsacas minuta]
MSIHPPSNPKRIGIVGYGSLGQYLMKELKDNPAYKIVFVWNRTLDKLAGVPSDLILSDLNNCASYTPDLIIEVAHPSITEQFGTKFLQNADYFSGSPTAFALKKVEDAMRAISSPHGVYIPAGALWGATDIKKMADRGNLESLRVTMIKHPSSFKLTGELLEKLEKSDPTKLITLYEGPVRDLCLLAPQNVNTMAAACIAGHTLGFDKTIGCLCADPALDKHQIIIEAFGTGGFKVVTQRDNPSKIGAVTGQATYASFLSSVNNAGGKGPGFHLC